MSIPFFSIVIPVYNRAYTVLPSLQSVTAQTFKNFECIIVDDGSIDSESLQQNIKNLDDQRFVYIRQENSGGGAARNTGIEAAKGKYIALLDSDDIYLPTKLEKAQRHLLSFPECTCLYTRVSMNRGIGSYWAKPSRALDVNEHIADYLMRRRGWIPTSTLVVESVLAKKIMYHSLLPYSQDTDFAIRLYNEGGIFYMDPEALTVVSDAVDMQRLSLKNHNYDTLKEWIDTLKPHIPIKAYYGYMGWNIAKKIVDQHFWKAAYLFARSASIGSYTPKMFIVVFCQVFLPPHLYRTAVNQILRMLAKLT